VPGHTMTQAQSIELANAGNNEALPEHLDSQQDDTIGNLYAQFAPKFVPLHTDPRALTHQAVMNKFPVPQKGDLPGQYSTDESFHFAMTAVRWARSKTREMGYSGKITEFPNIPEGEESELGIVTGAQLREAKRVILLSFLQGAKQLSFENISSEDKSGKESDDDNDTLALLQLSDDSGNENQSDQTNSSVVATAVSKEVSSTHTNNPENPESSESSESQQQVTEGQPKEEEAGKVHTHMRRISEALGHVQGQAMAVALKWPLMRDAAFMAHVYNTAPLTPPFKAAKFVCLFMMFGALASFIISD